MTDQNNAAQTAMQEAAFDSYSLNGDDFQEGCASEALQALDDDGRLTLGTEYRLGVSDKPDPADFFDVDHLIEQMQERAYDVGGEFAEDYLADLTEEQVKNLRQVVNAWLSSVAGRHRRTPRPSRHGGSMTDQNDAAPDLGTSSGGRAYIAEYFATQLRRHDFARYINNTLAADFACALAQHLSKLRAEGVQAGDEESPPIIPDDEEIAGACINASDIDGIAYDGPSFERGYRAALASAPVAGEAKRNANGAPPCWWIDHGSHGQITQREDEAQRAADEGKRVVSYTAAPQASEAEQTIIAAFLERSGQWLTNDAITKAARNAALEEAARIADMYRDNVHEHIRALKTQADKDDGDGILVSAEELGYVRRIKEAALFNHSRVPGGFVQVRQYDLRKTMQLFAKMESASLPAPLGSSWEASWAEFNTWHQRHFGAFVPVAPLDNARLIGWQAGTANERSRLSNQTPPTPQPQNRTEALHG
jgi:hypothetical protein